MFSPFVKRAMALLCTAALAGCSSFGPRTQSVQITVDNPDAIIYVNGEKAGTGRAQVELPRELEAVITAERGKKSETIILQRSISVLGALDIVGGSIIALPFLGLLTPGAYEFKPLEVEIFLD